MKVEENINLLRWRTSWKTKKSRRIWKRNHKWQKNENSEEKRWSESVVKIRQIESWNKTN